MEQQPWIKQQQQHDVNNIFSSSLSIIISLFSFNYLLEEEVYLLIPFYYKWILSSRFFSRFEKKTTHTWSRQKQQETNNKKVSFKIQFLFTHTTQTQSSVSIFLFIENYC